MGSSRFSSGLLRRSETEISIKYWCAILCGTSFIILFFSLEETNFHRERELSTSESTSSTDDSLTKQSAMTKGEISEPKMEDPKTHSTMTTPSSTKSYPQRLKLFERSSLRKPNRLQEMATRPLIFLTFPVIFYAGFSYGSNLVWFNVLNGTASLILSATRYGFSSSMVGLAYLSPLLGAVLG